MAITPPNGMGMRPDPPRMQPQNNWRNPGMPPNPFASNRPTLPGFFISSPMNITPQDVPMDGAIGFYPANDLSYIIIKQWSNNGTIDEARYVLARPAEEQQNQDDNQDNPDQTQDDTNTNAAIAAALERQTERLEGAFSQIGMAFQSLQQKLDTFAPLSFQIPSQALNDTASLPIQPPPPAPVQQATKGRKTKAEAEK